MNTKKFTLTAMFTALICIATIVIHINTPPNGYINIGDSIVLLGAFFLDPLSAMFAAGLGSALADLLSGSLAYIFATLIIKGSMALISGLIVKKHLSFLSHLIAAIIAETIMLLGYFTFEAIFLNFGLAALAGIPGNLIQGTVSLVIALILYMLLCKNKNIINLIKY